MVLCHSLCHSQISLFMNVIQLQELHLEQRLFWTSSCFWPGKFMLMCYEQHCEGNCHSVLGERKAVVIERICHPRMFSFRCMFFYATIVIFLWTLIILLMHVRKDYQLVWKCWLGTHWQGCLSIFIPWYISIRVSWSPSESVFFSEMSTEWWLHGLFCCLRSKWAQMCTLHTVNALCESLG